MASNYRHLFKATPFGPISWIADLLRASGGDTKGLDTLGDSMLGKYLGTNPTGQEQAFMNFNAEQAQLNRDFQERMSSTTYQRTVQDMKLAGLNPALLLTGASGVSTPSGSTASASPASGGSLTDLMSLALLPAQLSQISAQTQNIRANTRYTEQKTLTEEQLTKLQSIAVEWQPSINAENIANISASVDKQQAEILALTKQSDLYVSQKDLINKQSEAQAIVNYYLPDKTLAEIKKLDSDSRNAAASAWMAEIQAKFAKDNGFLMSSNDTLLLCTYIASLFGVEKGAVESTIGKVSNYVQKEFKYDFHPWRKVSPEDALAWYLEHK